MKKAKQTLSVLLSVFMLLLSLSVCFVSFAADASGGCGSGLTWTYSEASKTLTISGNGAMDDYQGKNDVSVRTPWDQYSSMTLRVVIGNGVTKIGSNAFRYYKSITKVECPQSLETIGEYAFASCTNLVSVKFSSILKNIGAHAFDKCTALNTFTIPDSVENIGDYAFHQCPISDLSLGRKVEMIGGYAFSECKLVNVTMYNKVEVIGQNAFYKQSGKTTNTISHVYYYGSQADWNAITLGNGNEPLTGAQLHILGAASDPVTPTNPTTPTAPTQPTQEESPAKLSFFERILQMILDFFARLFGR